MTRAPGFVAGSLGYEPTTGRVCQVVVVEEMFRENHPTLESDYLDSLIEDSSDRNHTGTFTDPFQVPDLTEYYPKYEPCSLCNGGRQTCTNCIGGTVTKWDNFLGKYVESSCRSCSGVGWTTCGNCSYGSVYIIP